MKTKYFEYYVVFCLFFDFLFFLKNFWRMWVKIFSPLKSCWLEKLFRKTFLSESIICDLLITFINFPKSLNLFIDYVNRNSNPMTQIILCRNLIRFWSIDSLYLQHFRNFEIITIFNFHQIFMNDHIRKFSKDHKKKYRKNSWW